MTMDMDLEGNAGKRYPPDFEEDTVKDDPDEEWDDEEAAATEDAEEERDSETEAKALTSARPRSKPDFGCIGAVIIFLAVVLFFGWVIVSAIVDVEKDKQEAKQRYRQALYPSRSYSEQRSSGGSSYSGSKSGSASSGGSSSYGSSGSGYKSKSSGGSKGKDEYNAADFGNPEDFYDEHYDDFFDYYDAEDYWNEYN